MTKESICPSIKPITIPAEQLLQRWKENPVLTPLSGSDWEGEQTRNPAAIEHEGRIHLIYTATGDIRHDHIIYLGHAVSEDGFVFERTSDSPYIEPSMDTFHGFDAGGVEDPRIVKIDDTFFMTYMARVVGYHAWRRGVRRNDRPNDAPTWTQNFRRGGLLKSRDLKTWERMGPITSDQHFDANVILFPEKIAGRYAMLHRPSDELPEASTKSGFTAGISIAFSDDLINWDDDQPLMGAAFDWEEKIGGSTPPIKTEAGWLTFYHSVEFDDESKSWHYPTFVHCYRVGLVLLDLDDPTKIIARSPHWLMEPSEWYEKWGTVGNVVFPTGVVRRDDKLLIYYGCADTVCGVATASVNKLLDYILQFS